MSFGPMLSRLVVARGTDVGRLARTAGVPEAEVTAACGRAAPSGPLLRAIAPSLGWHASDLMLAAGIRPPDDLAPADRGASIEWLVYTVVNHPEVRRRLPALLAAAGPPGPAATNPEYDRWFGPGFGALLLRLFANRNLTAVAGVKVMYGLVRFGPWSASTLMMVGNARKAVSPQLVAAAAVVLGLPVTDLAALAGMPPPDAVPAVHPATPDAVDLIWRARRLPPAAIDRLDEEASAIRRG
ncbi:hypothetical protein O7635_36605 [Asanoa sp. WMMD1127]|uniref:hypothetical protein n=1 Tax=Asanoa sp. WMMD1127 TaxID=3016107 RepID=UPI002415D9E6|nr:hypothetical protein [Asanoa sp. WMMD1127]MDG4827397.1 hypothetical protein [Asanoa sp. WMMD1127]